MEIQQTAATGVALKFSENSIAVNPPEKRKGGGVPPAVLLTTYPVPVGGWMNAFETDEGQHLFCGAGEYEKEHVYIRGFGTETTLQGMRVQTTSWCIDAEGVRVVLLGDVEGQKEVLQAISDVGDIDVLIPFCVVTKDKRLDAAGIAGIAASMQAKRIVPIGDDDALKKKITKEIGDTDTVVGKYVLKKKELLEGKTRVILFE